MSVRGLPTRNTSIVMFAWAPLLGGVVVFVARCRSHFAARQPNRGRSANFRLAAPLAPMTRVVERSEDARHSRRRGCGGSAASSSHSFLARAGSARASGLDLWADRASVVAFDCEPDRACLSSRSSDDLADAISDQLDRARCARCATCCRVSRLRGTRRFHPGRRLAPTASRRRGIDPRSDRLRLPCCVGTSCTPDI